VPNLLRTMCSDDRDQLATTIPTHSGHPPCPGATRVADRRCTYWPTDHHKSAGSAWLPSFCKVFEFVHAFSGSRITTRPASHGLHLPAAWPYDVGPPILKNGRPWKLLFVRTQRKRCAGGRNFMCGRRPYGLSQRRRNEFVSPTAKFKN